MNLKSMLVIIQWMGGLIAFAALGFVLYGVWQGTQRQPGRTSGRAGSWLRSWCFYLASSTFFFGIAYLGWIPLPISISSTLHTWVLVAGSLLYFPGMALLLWGRLELGRNYFVSTGLGAQLFSNQQLVTTGPYAFVRHPMYVGLILSALGAVLLYTTWTTVYFACFAPLMFIRAKREEQILSAEFGEKWKQYCRRVPAFIPRLRKDVSTMSETKPATLSNISATYLAPLYWKAIESQRPDAMIKDEKAVALVTQLSIDFSRVKRIPMNELLKAMRIIFTREMDRYARDFIRRHPAGVVVHIGCGLDSRFERVDNGQVEWYDLDLPDVIALRRKFIGDERERYRLLACSVLEDAWLEVVKIHSQRPFLFLAETVFVYFSEAQVKSLVLRLRDHFSGAELVFDGWRPFEVWLGNRYLSNSLYAGLMRWGFWRGQKIEGWGDGIRLLDEWGFFDQPEPRLNPYRWMAPLFRLFKPMRIFRFQLGEALG